MPKLTYHIFGCINQRPEGHARGCCASKGSEAMWKKLKAMIKERGIQGVRMQSSSCHDECEKGPVVVVYPHNWWLRIENENDMNDLISSLISQSPPPVHLSITVADPVSVQSATS